MNENRQDSEQPNLRFYTLKEADYPAMELDATE